MEQINFLQQFPQQKKKKKTVSFIMIFINFSVTKNTNEKKKKSRQIIWTEATNIKKTDDPKSFRLNYFHDMNINFHNDMTLLQWIIL